MRVEYKYMCVCVCVCVCVCLHPARWIFEGTLCKKKKKETQRPFRSFCLTPSFLNNPWAIFKALKTVLYDMM